jgi:hypothetical protein
VREREFAERERKIVSRESGFPVKRLCARGSREFEKNILR